MHPGQNRESTAAKLYLVANEGTTPPETFNIPTPPVFNTSSSAVGYQPSPRRVSMSDVSREEVNAKLEATEARLDAKLANIAAELRVNSNLIATSIEASRSAQKAAEQAKDAAVATRWNIVISVLATAAILVSLIFGLNSAIWQAVSAVHVPSSPSATGQPNP